MVELEGGEWWDRAAVAAFIGVQPDSVSAYLSKEQMPVATYFGRTPMWRPEVIKEWAANRRGRAQR